MNLISVDYPHGCDLHFYYHCIVATQGVDLVSEVQGAIKVSLFNHKMKTPKLYDSTLSQINI